MAGKEKKPWYEPSEKFTLFDKCSIPKAEEILHTKVFGLTEWETFFGNKFTVGRVPEIPWTESELILSKIIGQDSFIFLGMEFYDKEYLNSEVWPKIFKFKTRTNAITGGEYTDLNIINKESRCKLRWYCMPVGIANGTAEAIDKNQPQQIAKLMNGYEVPTAIERVTANVLYFKLYNKFMDTLLNPAYTSDTTTDPFGKKFNLHISSTKEDGIRIGYGPAGILSMPGFAASLKLPQK